MTDKVKLQLGDLIQIIAPNDPSINEASYYYINYIDENKIRLEEPDGLEQELGLTDGYWDNESIEKIIIKSRAEELGYARQNNLQIGVWIDIYFNGDLPLTLTGKITNLEEDKIEVTTYPTREVIFIDFGYKGLPEDLPLEKINIRKAPPQDQEREDISEPSSLEELEKKYTELQKALLEMPDNEVTNEDLDFTKQKKIQEETRQFIFKAGEITFGNNLEAITQMVDVPEEEQRYDIDKQLDALMDDMLSTIPNAKRTDAVKNNIHKMIQRFKELRENFSVFDDKGYVLKPKVHGQHYKPIVETLAKLDQKLYWLLPVVKIIKKIYNDESEDEDENSMEFVEDDIHAITFADDYKAAKEIVDKYSGNENEGNRYAQLQKKLNPYFTPFLPVEEKSDIIATLSVNTTITALIDTLDNFNSSVNGTDTFETPSRANKFKPKRKIQQKRFALQTYTTGASGLDITKVRGDNPIIKRKELTKNDELDLKSIVTLPESTVRFSRINLQTPTILDKANLNLHFLNYWQLLNSKTAVTKTTIIDLNSPYPHDAEKFLKTVQNFTLDDNFTPEKDLGLKYTNFLDNIIPKTKNLFQMLKPYLEGSLSIKAILAYLEPFMIYQEDLNVLQYKEMNHYISEKISEYRSKYATKAREYSSIKGNQNASLPSLIKILDENANLRTKVLDVYGFTNTIMTMSNADFIKRIYEVDGGIFYNNAIALISTNLMMADGTRDMADINIYLNKEKQDSVIGVVNKPEKTAKKSRKMTVEGGSSYEGGATECQNYKVIAKRYIALDELNADSGGEIYFDKKYDPTYYDIGEKFKADNMLPAKDQIRHYMEKLIKNKGLDEVTAQRDAKAILKGKRVVEDGDYAILETTDETSATIQYYVRQRENWILDNTIDAKTFADTMQMFCNLNEKCIAVKNNCEDQTSGANEIKKNNLKLLLAEFNTVLNVNKEIITNKIENEFASADSRIDSLRNLMLMQLYKYEDKKIEIAHTAEEKIVIVSPYEGLLNTITLLKQTDIAKYYQNIAEFVKTFTREGLPENDESHFWFYCVKSNKKLLPTFIYKLATTFLTDGNFAQMLDKICALQGTLSDDGDKYVDKYSGHTIKMIEMNTDEEYNEEGFKIITRAIMEDDVGDVLTEALKTLPTAMEVPAVQKRTYITPAAMAIYNVIDALSTNMGLTIADQKDFIVRNVLKQLSNTAVMPTETAYAKIFATMQAKGKPIDTYEVAYNAVLMFLTLAYYLIAIQISVPPVKTKTTFPGCKKSFSGFPLEGAESNNTKGLTYVACVAYKLRNKGALPWSAIANRSDKFIATQMEAMITKYILATEEVQNGIKQLKLYLSEHPETAVIPTEHNIESWSNFLPPLKPLKMSNTQDVGDVFKTRLVESLKKGKKDQEDYMAELHSKMFLFSFHIIELIEKTVHGEHAILNSKSGEPFLENACCELGENNTIRFFIKKQPEIANYNNKVVRLGDMLADAKKLSKAVLLYDPSNTKRKLREIDNKFSEQTIYRAFIVYCKFNSLVPLNENLKAVCPTKPEFDSNDSLEESIRKLKSNARIYSEETMQRLLEVINNETKTMIKKEEKTPTNVDRLLQLMEQMDAENKRSSVFRTDFMNVLGTFELNELHEDTPEMRKLKNLLPKLNANMLTQITDFIGKFNESQSVNFKKFKACLESIPAFKETGNNLILGKKEETCYKMINFMKKTMRSLTKEFPNIIMNKVDYTNVNVPVHWELSGIHQNNLKEDIKKHYDAFLPLYNDAQINLLMEKFIALSSDINELAQNTLFYAPVELTMKQKATEISEHTTPSAVKYSTFDIDLTTLLFEFYFFNVLTDLISLQTDKELLGVPLKQLKSKERSETFMTKSMEMNILAGNKAELANKIAKVVVMFTNAVCGEKKVIDHNYKSLMNIILRSKEREKTEITDYLKKMTVEERAIEEYFKKHKLERWSVGQQKGLHSYEAETYDREMEQKGLLDAKLNKKSGVTAMNRDILGLDVVNTEASDDAIEKEDNMITYMGEDAEPEDYGMDGDENYDY